jgi:hypothetical protein
MARICIGKRKIWETNQDKEIEKIGRLLHEKISTLKYNFSFYKTAQIKFLLFYRTKLLSLMMFMVLLA